jgi:hypothetical protein
MNLSDQFLNHLFIKFTVYSLFLRHQKMLSTLFSLTIFRSLSCNDSHPSLNILCHSNTFVLNKYCSLYALSNISNVSVAVFFNFTQKLIAALCSILKPSI